MNLSPNPAAEIRESIGQIRSGFCFDVKESKTSRRPRLTQTRFTLPSIWRRRHRSGREKFRQVSKVRERLRGNVANVVRSRVFLLFLSFFLDYIFWGETLLIHTHTRPRFVYHALSVENDGRFPRHVIGRMTLWDGI